MNRVDIIQSLGEIFKKNKITVVLVGGFAVNYYRYSRQTDDIDFMILTSAYENILPHLQQEGFIPFLHQEAFARLENKKQPGFMVDFLFVDPDTFEHVVREAKTVQVSGVNFLVPSLFHLIAMKLHAIKHNPSRREPKDLLDIVALMKENNLSFESEEFQKLCVKYGSPETLKKLQLFLGIKNG